jgi:urease accessory protein
MIRILQRIALVAPALLIAGNAEAHTGLAQTAGLASGFVHPLLGLDHLLVLLAAGVYAGTRDDGIFVRLLFVVLAAVGAGLLLAAAGMPQGAVTAGLAVAGLLIGLALLCELRVAASWAAAVAVLVGLLHGHAHGVEVAAAPGFAAYAAGLMAATALLLAVGALCGAAGRAHPRLGAAGIRGFGAAVSTAMLFLAVT